MELRREIEMACETILAGTLEDVTKDVRHLSQMCLEAGGLQFERLLKYHEKTMSLL